MNLTVEQIKMLAKAEVMMDRGEKPFVIFGGNRMMMDDQVMEKLGLQPGQTINWDIFEAIKQENLQRVQLEILLDRIKKEAASATKQPPTGDKKMEKKHWYCVTFRGFNIINNISTTASTYIGYSSENAFCMPEINRLKETAGVKPESVLLNIIYLGCMTKEEFTDGVQ